MTTILESSPPVTLYEPGTHFLCYILVHIFGTVYTLAGKTRMGPPPPPASRHRTSPMREICPVYYSHHCKRSEETAATSCHQNTTCCFIHRRVAIQEPRPLTVTHWMFELRSAYIVGSFRIATKPQRISSSDETISPRRPHRSFVIDAYLFTEVDGLQPF